MEGFDQCSATQTQGLQRDANRAQMPCSTLWQSSIIVLNHPNPRHPDSEPTGACDIVVLSRTLQLLHL